MVKGKALKGLGNKYGATLRNKYTTVYIELKQKRVCPNCGSSKFKRLNNGIWGCSRCGFKEAGGAYAV
ncbi:MAG: transposase [Nitrososphaerota archaeon]|jgi:large subunit ribosomal protein L37Ae|nr:transposase [Nitrososphaerota archaeon]MDG7036873.1 transposase [Nitrososphaerota archaeon]MDG7038027.1 transposase [Nitrososphaerota archaeon]MDG7043093.1 transposase [Nitrososphaerota archaeon]MDG7044751.1 transposase [Nitrososphaerota archaeon]